MPPKIFLKRVKHVLGKNIKKILFYTNKLTRTAHFWDQTDTAISREYWGNIKAIKQLTQKRITGNPSLSWYTKQIRERKNPFGRILTFGDGHGMAAEAFLTKRDTSEIVYINISAGEGERFKKKMEELNIDIPCSFIRADANLFDFSSIGHFDTIIDVGAFHHFSNFESIFPQLNNQLKPEGVMYVDEYVGPSKWTFSQMVIDTINELLLSLPEQLVAHRLKVRKKDFERIWKNCGDPSEAIRSGELDQALHRYFKVEEAVFFGGSLLMPFFMTSHLDPCRLNIDNWHNTEIGISESERLVRFEQNLVTSGKLNKDYQYYKIKKVQSIERR